MKFKMNNREYETYQLSNTDLVELLRGETLTVEERTELNKALLERFECDLCPRKNEGETDDHVFARFFGNFVNGRLRSKKEVAEKMSHEHRYLQNEMFKVCLAYIQKLAENYEKGYYDPRNEYACKASTYMLEGLKTNDYPY